MNYKNLYILITILLFITIILLSSILYFLFMNKSKDKIIYKENIIYKDVIKETNKKEDLSPIYPKNLPLYNNTSSYQQIGILTSNETDKEPIILPLFSRKIHNRNDRWNYYTASDKYNMMRLPIVIDNINCDDEIGCKEIYNNDIIYLDIYKGRAFTATIYKNDVPKYFADRY